MPQRFHQCRIASLEDPMTTTRTRQAGVTAYYLGRPAAFWLAVSAPQRTKPTRKFSC
jgi:hypothetical protein